ITRVPEDHSSCLSRSYLPEPTGSTSVESRDSVVRLNIQGSSREVNMRCAFAGLTLALTTLQLPAPVRAQSLVAGSWSRAVADTDLRLRSPLLVRNAMRVSLGEPRRHLIRHSR